MLYEYKQADKTKQHSFHQLMIILTFVCDLFTHNDGVQTPLIYVLSPCPDPIEIISISADTPFEVSKL